MTSLFRRFTSLWKKEQPTAAPVQTPEAPPLESPGRQLTERQQMPSQSESANDKEVHHLLSEEQVYDALRQCRDPEIPVNIVDLGLVYDVRINEEHVNVKMTLTTQGCGMGGYITQEAEEHIRALPGVQNATVEIVWDPPWNPSMISASGRKTLGLPEE
ncbi:MAG: metal-sulfur cluster assembly factor [Candidatus Binatia bacterium]